MAGRPSSVDKRRGDILDATRRLLLKSQQPRLVNLADIANELDLTTNAVRYYYRSVDEVLQEVHDLSVERFYTRRREGLQSLDSAELQLAVTISAGLPHGPDDAEWSIMWRALVTSTMDLKGSDAVIGAMHLQVTLYEEILALGIETGEFTPLIPTRDIARTLVALEDYFGFRVVAHDDRFDRAEALRLLRQYAELTTHAALPGLN